MNMDYFDRIWQGEEDAKGMKHTEPRQAWDNRAEEFNSHGRDERRDRIIDLLLEKQMLDRNSTVLDIGCGPGKFVIEFAPTAHSVIGVDLSPKMLQYAAENAAARRLNNVKFRELNWHTADLAALNWQKKFSLVTGIMSPAISNRASLEKMIAAGNQYGLICHFVERHDSVGDRLKTEILGRDVNHEFGNTSLYCSFNVLWLYKLFPEVAYFDLEREVTRPVAEAYETSIAKFEMRGELTAAQKTEIRRYLHEMADDNDMVTEKVTSKIACIYWQNR